MGTKKQVPRPLAETEREVRRLLAEGDHRGAATVALRHLGQEVLRYLQATLRAEGDVASASSSGAGKRYAAVPDVEEAAVDEAAVAEAFSRVAEAMWLGLPSFRGECSLRTWALRLAAGAVADVRSARRGAR